MSAGLSGRESAFWAGWSTQPLCAAASKTFPPTWTRVSDGYCTIGSMLHCRVSRVSRGAGGKVARQCGDHHRTLLPGRGDGTATAKSIDRRPGLGKWLRGPSGLEAAFVAVPGLWATVGSTTASSNGATRTAGPRTSPASSANGPHRDQGDPVLGVGVPRPHPRSAAPPAGDRLSPRQATGRWSYNADIPGRVDDRPGRQPVRRASITTYVALADGLRIDVTKRPG